MLVTECRLLKTRVGDIGHHVAPQDPSERAAGDRATRAGVKDLVSHRDTTHDRPGSDLGRGCLRTHHVVCGIRAGESKPRSRHGFGSAHVLGIKRGRARRYAHGVTRKNSRGYGAVGQGYRRSTVIHLVTGRDVSR